MRRLLPALLGPLLLLLLWEGFCRLTQPPPYLLPSPTLIWAALQDTWPVLLASAGTTFLVALKGLAIAVILSLILAAALSLSPFAERMVRPLAIALSVTPVVAIAPLLVVWAGLDHAGRATVALAAIVAFYPVFSGALTGLKAADPNLERLFSLYGASPLQRLARLRAPSAVPHLIEGVRVSANLAVVGAVVAEFVSGSGAHQGLAFRILEAGNRLRTAEMFGALLVLTLLGLALNLVLQRLERSAFAFWKGSALGRD
ncbi:ABC transporter permease [Brevundimonas sp. 2R-24]|uniref:ABC transporter permease n=1 Tax=Peiella sedimenti TaxID=3061083 RepID=A0ABT8SKC8_9CAUL|nr:ABC transporter permease [Caulobacteraceae bacterium XZ-24]